MAYQRLIPSTGRVGYFASLFPHENIFYNTTLQRLGLKQNPFKKSLFAFSTFSASNVYNLFTKHIVVLVWHSKHRQTYLNGEKVNIINCNTILHTTLSEPEFYWVLKDELIWIIFIENSPNTQEKRTSHYFYHRE